MSSELLSFIKEALQQGNSRQEIRTVLMQAKWSEEEIDASLQRFADVSFAVPVPAPEVSVSAREAFVYLVLFVALYLTAFSVGSLWFSFINYGFPDELYRGLSYTSIDSNSVRQASATILIAGPLFFWLSRYVQKRLARHPEEQQSAVRRWLTYLTLFVAASIIIGTLITLVNNVLSGELTWRFTLKVLSMLVITGSVFGYYLWDLRRDEDTVLQPAPRRRLRVFVISTILVIIATLGTGLYLSGSPAKERLRRLDEQHIQTLQQVTYAIDTFTNTRGRVPTRIDELWEPSSSLYPEITLGMTDSIPDFSYRTSATSSYELCASFNLATEQSSDFGAQPSYVDPTLFQSWNHGAGLTCFPRTVRPILK